MDKLLQDLSSGYWWVGVVVVGILINIVSSYLRRFMENRFSNFSHFWRHKRQARIDDFNRKVQLLRSNPDLKFIYALREGRYRIRSVAFLVFSVFGLLFGFWLDNREVAPALGLIVLAVAAVSVFLGMYDHIDATRVERLVDAATEGIREFRT